jgi:hypothetical protein
MDRDRRPRDGIAPWFFVDREALRLLTATSDTDP